MSSIIYTASLTPTGRPDGVVFAAKGIGIHLNVTCLPSSIWASEQIDPSRGSEDTLYVDDQ